jgi:hypothetical protein
MAVLEDLHGFVRSPNSIQSAAVVGRDHGFGPKPVELPLEVAPKVLLPRGSLDWPLP